MVKLYLDDLRPVPDGWLLVKTAQDAIRVLEKGHVEHLSLDHDLGACEECLQGMTPEEWLVKNDLKSMPNCEHFGTGYTVVCWMEETGIWPEHKPTVHSANPVGRARMQQVIDRKYNG